MFCYSNNGASMRAVDPSYAAQAGEVLFLDYATEAQLARNSPLTPRPRHRARPYRNQP